MTALIWPQSPQMRSTACRSLVDLGTGLPFIAEHLLSRWHLASGIVVDLDVDGPTGLDPVVLPTDGSQTAAPPC